ncbi:MAG: hypothetical protein U0228_17650 [Myxococcaceae bacterium]
MRHLWPLAALLVSALTACPVGPGPDDASTPDAGLDAGNASDAGTDAGSYEPPPIDIGRSLFWNDAGVLDDASLISFSKVMAVASDDGHGGALLSQWFHRFNTTAHSERAIPAQFIDALALTQGSDPHAWDLSLLPFKATGIHNRIDLAKLTAGGHCGELRVSFTSTDVTLSPFHVLFLFRQPALADDVDGTGRVTCTGTARRWAELSALDETTFRARFRDVVAQGFTHERFLLFETVEFTLAPWEWRQWVPQGDGGVDNPALFQQLDVERLNVSGTYRDDFLAWVDANAAQLDARRVEFPERFRVPSIRVNQGVTRPPLLLPARTDFPQLRQELEIVGCAACHTADAEFVQTRADRTASPFYEKELLARAAHLAELARGIANPTPFGPLQANPVLPP